MKGDHPRPRLRRWLIHSLRGFLRTEAAGGVVLLVATVAALLWANSPIAESYDDVWHAELSFGIGRFTLTESVQHWINDGLMALFFFVVGLEIKRELVVGELRDPRAAALPVIAAVGGMLGPAALYALVNVGGPGAVGWGIPMATDIAFAVGLLAVLGPRVPSGLKLFLLTLAIVDDVGAILVIAVFYSSGISFGWIEIALVGLLIVGVMRYFKVPHPLLYVPVGAAVWLATFESGIHPTIAGVAIALMTPTRPVRGRPVLEQLEHLLHPVSSYLIIPLFALANAGVVLSPSAFDDAIRSPVFWGIPLGLVVGKMVGISVPALVAARLGVGRLPLGARPLHIVGIAALGGIGFTVSLFISQLAFRGSELLEHAKMGVLTGSALAAAIGATVLLRARPREVPVVPSTPSAVADEPEY